MSKSNWNLRLPNWREDPAVAPIAQALGITKPTAALLCARGYRTPEEARAFLEKDQLLFHDPLQLPDMERAVARIKVALAAKEKITVYGDYDVDGVTSTSILYLYLQNRGAEVAYYIPERFSEGYGINSTALDQIAADGTTLLITVDTGITAVEEAKHLQTLGMDLIITDHHACLDVLPAAVAVVNPHRADSIYPFADLAGVGVTFKLLCALEQDLQKDSHENYLRNLCQGYADLVALGTIADMVPLTDENRLIVSIGLRVMEQGEREGLNALMEAAGADRGGNRSMQKKRITSSTVGFTLAPRINAAGRIGSAEKGVSLFLAKTTFSAKEIAAQLCEDNRRRQAEETAILKQIDAMVGPCHDFTAEPVLVLAAKGWHQGVIGIVASRVTERYHCPSVMISIDENGMGKGSARSVEAMNLVDALTACKDTLVRYGGHAQAAGLTVEASQIDAFRQQINAYAKTVLSTTPNPAAPLFADLVLTIPEMTLKQAGELDLLEPYGCANPQPLFCVENVQVAEVVSIGNGKHTRLTLQQGDAVLTALAFGKTQEMLGVESGDFVSVVGQLDINEFQNVRSVQMILRDLALEYSPKEAEQQRCYRRLKQARPLYKIEIPVRAEFAKVYMALRALLPGGSGAMGLSVLQTFCTDVELAKLRVILEIFTQAGLLQMQELAGSAALTYRFTLLQPSQKAILEQTPLYADILSRVEPEIVQKGE